MPSGMCDSRSMYCGKVSQSTFIDTRIGSRGIASVRERASMARSASCGRRGAKPNPQLPIVTEVTPCQLPIVQYGSQCKLGIIVGVEINKSRGDNQPAGIDHLGCIVAVQATNFGNLAILDADVGAVPGDPCPVTTVPFLIMVSNCGITPPSFLLILLPIRLRWKRQDDPEAMMFV